MDQFLRTYKLSFRNVETGVVTYISSLHCAFEIEKNVDNKDKKNTGKVSITNLSRETTNLIGTRYGQLRLEVGYGDTLGVLVESDVVNVATKDNLRNIHW